jgi:hypothetical protein
VEETTSLEQGGMVRLRAQVSAVHDAREPDPEPVLDWRFVALVA